ncbi:hypothetical protein REPUB_Repub11eG0007900 [Reevesia pubescens]
MPMKKKKGTRKKKAKAASSSSSLRTFFDAEMIDEQQKVPQTNHDCSLNASHYKRKLNEIHIPENNSMKKQKGKEILIVIDEAPFVKAACDSSKEWFCKICMEQKPSSSMFKETRCDHSFCFDCTRNHIATKLKDENMIMVHCPESNCKSLITPQQCTSILPGEVIYRWEKALRYTQIPPILIFDCPFEDCSAKLQDDGKEIGVIEYECPECERKICSKCRDFKHEGMDCNEFKELVKRAIEEEENEKEEEEFEIVLVKLAEKENWKRCPNCNNFAGKKDGSNKVECW